YFSCELYLDGNGVCDRLADGFDRGISRDHESSSRADVDGFRRAISHGNGARMDPGHHVGESADVFDLLAQQCPAAPKCEPWGLGKFARQDRCGPAAAARQRRDGRAEGCQQRSMKYAASILVVLLAACNRQPPLPVYGQIPPFQLTAQTGETFDSRE